MAYDPKRPRPAASTSETAPVDALLASVGADETAPKVEDAPKVEAAPKVDAAPSGPKPQQASEVPVAAAPEEGTANRAVLLAVAGASLAVAAVLIILSRSRRRSSKD